ETAGINAIACARVMPGRMPWARASAEQAATIWTLLFVSISSMGAARSGELAWPCDCGRDLSRGEGVAARDACLLCTRSIGHSGRYSDKTRLTVHLHQDRRDRDSTTTTHYFDCEPLAASREQICFGIGPLSDCT